MVSVVVRLGQGVEDYAFATVLFALESENRTSPKSQNSFLVAENIRGLDRPMSRSKTFL